jgi:hypothetical protein
VVPSPRVSTRTRARHGPAPCRRRYELGSARCMELSGSVDLPYNEPYNPSHPPGRSPASSMRSRALLPVSCCSDTSVAWLLRLAYAALRFACARARREPGPVRQTRGPRRAQTWRSSRGRIRSRRGHCLRRPYGPSCRVAWLADRLGAATVVLVRVRSRSSELATLGWQVSPAELARAAAAHAGTTWSRPEELERLTGCTDAHATACLLWRATRTRSSSLWRPIGLRSSVCRHEDLATHPVCRFPRSVRHAGRVWSPAVEQPCAANAATSEAGKVDDRCFRWSCAAPVARTRVPADGQHGCASSYPQHGSVSEIERVAGADVRRATAVLRLGAC